MSLDVVRMKNCFATDVFCHRCHKRIYEEPVWVVVGDQVFFSYCERCARLSGLKETNPESSKKVFVEVVRNLVG